MKALYLSCVFALTLSTAFSQQSATQNQFENSISAVVSTSDFSAVKNNNCVQLTWSAITENNMSNYEIEKSANGSPFTSIGTVTAQNNSTTFKYNYPDATPTEGKNYYRLRLTDNRGNITFSKVVMADNEYRKKDIMIMSNLVTGHVLNLQLANFAQGKYSIILYSNAGLQVFARSMDFSDGTATQIINLPASVERGSYFLQVNDGMNRINKQVIIE